MDMGKTTLIMEKREGKTMNNNKTYNFKKQNAYPTNPLFLKQIPLSCNFCKNNGPKKIFANLWQLHYHFLWHHKTENWLETESSISKLIQEGVLR